MLCSTGGALLGGVPLWKAHDFMNILDVTVESEASFDENSLLMEEIHQLVDSLFYYLQGFVNSRWCKFD